MIPIPDPALFPWYTVPVMVLAPALESALMMVLALNFKGFYFNYTPNFALFLLL